MLDDKRETKQQLKTKSEVNEKIVFKRKITNQSHINARNSMKYTNSDCSHFE